MNEFYEEMTKRRVAPGYRLSCNKIYYIETYRFIKLKRGGKLDGYEYYMQLINKIEKIDTMFKCGFLLLGQYSNGKLLYHNDNRINSMENMGDGNEDDFGKEKIIY